MPRPAPALRLAPALLLLAAPALPARAAPPACQEVEEGQGPAGATPVRAEVVASGLEVPWALAFLPGGDVLLTERPGRLRLLRRGRLLPEPVARVAVAPGGEGGLLGLALDPGFARNRRFYLYYTAQEGTRSVNRVARWVLSGDGRSAREDRVLVDGIAARQFHDGGRIRFGPDGLLYVGTGDAGNPASAQDPASLNGKVLRLTADGGIPPDNPSPGSPVFLSGVRNVEAFDWLDPRTLALADHGPSGELDRRGGDELDVARAGDNLGWPDLWKCQAGPDRLAPSLAFREAVPPGGLAVYRGEAIAAWKGSVLVGTLRSRALHRFELDANGAVASHEVYLAGDPPAGLGRVREVAQGPDGALWVTTSNCDGRGTCPAKGDVVARILPR